MIIHGNNIEKLKEFPDNYFDAIVTDPPYGLGKEPDAVELMKDWVEKGYHEISGVGFMGKEWDAFVPQPIFWKEVFRVLKHGGHVLSFFGTRTYDWGVMSMRFAGFEVRDCIQWIYGSGFPKSHNISKAIDKKPNLEKIKDWKKWLEIQINKSKKSQKQINDECGFNAIGYARYESNDYWATNRPSIEKWDKMKFVVGIETNDWDFICDSNEEERGYVKSTSGLGGGTGNTVGKFSGRELSNNSISPQAKQWDGWGSALKPAHEDLVLARKPFQFSSDLVYLYENIVYNLKLQICQSKLFAKDVKEIFTLSQKDLKGVELDFAQWSAGKPFNTKEDLLVLMDMLQLEMNEGNTTLNIVLLWLNTLVELWNVANTYTTETESSTITELRILNSLEWESIFQNITLLKDNKTNGLIANVLTVESLFSVLNLKLNDILTHSAKENVTLKESEKNFVPNSEPIVLARKPLEKGLSIAENVLKWGTGAINIDGCRISTNEIITNHSRSSYSAISKGKYGDSKEQETHQTNGQTLGRFPANLILTHHPDCECKGLKKVKAISGGKGENSMGGMGKNGIYGQYVLDKLGSNAGGLGDENGEETVEHWECVDGCPIKIMDEQSGETNSQRSERGNILNNNVFGKYKPQENTTRGHNDSGGASRFFYVAKASKSERNRGLSEFEDKFSASAEFRPNHMEKAINGDSGNPYGRWTPIKNFHPTVKPVKLMQYLVRLITPTNGKVLDPFCGSGTTGIACKLEGFEFVGIEQDIDYCKIAESRIINYTEEPDEELKIIQQNLEKKVQQLVLF